MGACSSRVNEYPVPRRVDLGASRAEETARLIEEYDKCAVGIDRRRLFFVQQQFRLFTEENDGDQADTALFYVGRIYYDAGDDYNTRLTFRRHKRAFPRSHFRPWIEEMEQEMDDRLRAYREWLEATRSGQTISTTDAPLSPAAASSYPAR